jgi:tRNA-dihydrouridine synthase B
MPKNRKISIGNVEFGHPPIILAPMEDVTDPPFRAICRQMGADWVFSEFIAADGLIRDAAKSIVKLDIYPEERPVSIQIFGANIDSMVEAAKIVEQSSPDFIDINFGCPVRKVATKGAGAGMLQDVPKMVEMTRRVVDAVKTPVTVKTRLGWDQHNRNIVDIAERLQDTGIAALTIHGRTRCQLYTGIADWTLIGEVKNNPRMHIPIIGNGDIIDGPGAKNALETYGVDGIMIGRASIGNPWVFRQVKHFLETGEILPPPSINDRGDVCRKHLEMSVAWKGEKLAVFEMRRHYCTYFKGISNFKPFRIRLVTASTYKEVLNIIEEIRNYNFEAV